MQIGRLKFRGDQYIWFAVFMLSLIGLLAVYSATGSLAFKKQGGNTEYFVIRHVMFLFGGFFSCTFSICWITNIFHGYLKWPFGEQ